MMKVNELKKELADGVVRSAYLFYGEEGYLVLHYINQIKGLLLPDSTLADFNLSVFDKMDLEAIGEYVKTPPVFAERKLLIVKDTGLFKTPRAEDKEYWEAALSDIPPYLCILFAETAIDKRQKKLLSLVEKNGAVVEFKYMEEAQLKSWMNILIRQRGKKITVKNMDYLLSCCGTQMEHIEHEVDKLCSYAEGEAIDKQQIDELVAKPVENRIFDLANAILQKRPNIAFAILLDLKSLRESPIKIVSILSKNFCDIYKVAKATAPTPQSTGLHPYVLKLHQRTASAVPEKKLAGMIALSASADLKLKSSAADEWLLLEEYVAALME